MNSHSVFRQKHQTKKTNALLFGESQKLAVEESRLKKEPDTRANRLLLQAVCKLGLREYERYKSNLLRTADYATEDTKDPVSGEVTGTVVKSTRYPDAPPRLLRKGERCRCSDRIAELDMCVHEICCDGFDEELFLPRHLRRDRVSGSLEGWSPPELSESPLNDMLDSDEVIFDPPPAAAKEEKIDACLGNPDMPEGYFPDRSTKVKPLPKTDVQRVLSTAIASYNGAGDEKKFEISSLVVQLEKLLTNDSNASVVESGGTCLVVPSDHMKRTQKKDRLKSASHMAQQRKRKFESQQLGRISVAAQNRGLCQTVSC